MATRLAQKMGYHRDPKHLSSISPFESEMRRRAWYYIEIFDMTMSAHQGIPAMINEDECDVQLPINLLDEDFDENTVVMPPPRSNTTHIPMLFFTCKAEALRLLRPIVRHSLSSRRYDLEETNRLHESLEIGRHNVPPSLRIRTIAETSFVDQDYLIMQRFMLELQYLKGFCILHRPFLGCKKNDPACDKSREICVNTALRQLDLQTDYYEALQPQGRLYQSRWMFTNITLHEQFAAAMIICLDLNESRSQSIELKARKVKALYTARHIWSSKRPVYRDAVRASHVLGVMIAKLTGDSAPPLQIGDMHERSPPSAEQVPHVPQQDVAPPQDADYDMMNITSLENIFENADMLNWNDIDSYLIDYSGSINHAGFDIVLAMCALSSARVRDGALYTGKWDATSLQSPSSEELFEAAREAIPHDASLTQDFDYARAYALLAICSIQYGDTPRMNYYIGMCQGFLSVGMLQDESNWPAGLTHIELEERRRLFWSLYTLDIFSSIIWGGYARSREACFNVCYPSDDEQSGDMNLRTTGDMHDGPSWLTGWNFVTTLYRILEHAQDRLGHLRNPVQRTPSLPGYIDPGSPRQISCLTNIMTLYEQLPPVFKTTQPLTGILEKDLFGFQAANIAASLQLVRMVLFTTENSTVDQKCQIASEVINGFASVPVAYLRAISSPLLHHLAGIGGIMGSAFEDGLTETSYRRVRSVLLDLANLLANLEVDLFCRQGTSDKLRAQVSRIDDFMKIQRSVDSGTVMGLTPWANQPTHPLASPGLHAHHQLELSHDSPQIHFPPSLFENWNWAFDFN
ncbi:hypothetical protein E4T50_07323 [Aureobasidium sp. EXF-12298]|nr:hypothetical protein E4T50_07323 [Aureobasidium sp. EXF-12298]